MLSTFRRFLRRSKAHDPADKRANSVKDDTLTSKESSFVKCLNIKRSSYGDTRGRLTWQLERLWRLHEELQLQLLELRIGTVPNNRRTKLQDAIAQARVINIASSNFADVPRGDWEPGWKSRRSVRNSPAQLCGNEAYAFNGHLNLRQVASAHRMRRLRAWSSGHQGSRLTVQSGLAPQELVKLPIQLSLQQLEGQKWSRTAVNSTVTGIQGPVEDSKVCKSQLQMASQASSRQQKEPADKVYRKTEPTTMQTLQPWRKVKKVDKFEKRTLPWPLNRRKGKLNVSFFPRKQKLGGEREMNSPSKLGQDNEEHRQRHNNFGTLGRPRQHSDSTKTIETLR